jgi:hypothetical protein
MVENINHLYPRYVECVGINDYYANSDITDKIDWTEANTPRSITARLKPGQKPENRKPMQ